MKSLLTTRTFCLLLVGLLSWIASPPAQAWHPEQPLGFAEAPTWLASTEIEEYLIIRGQPPVVEQAPEGTFPTSREVPGGRRERPRPPIEDIVERDESQAAPSGGASEILQQATTTQTTTVRQRSPISQDPYVRGYGGARLHSVADGAFWTSARADLDSILGKIDPSLVDQIVVLPGPYGLRYGPGFAFIDIGMVQTPRYECGFEIHNRFGLNTRFNGGQVYGTDTVYGGAENYGFLFTYGHRIGSDYFAGNGLRIPSSYNVSNLLGQVGFDWGCDSNVEVRYQYVNEWDTEYAAQFFDVNSMVTNAVSVAYTKGNPEDIARIETDAWYYDTRYSGDTRNPSKRLDRFPVLQRVDQALAEPSVDFDGQGNRIEEWYGNFDGDTFGALMSTGARTALVLEPVDELRTRIGTDLRLIDQVITEDYNMERFESINGGTPTSDPVPFTTNLPKSTLVNPGLYAESTLEWLPYWTTAIGGRLDWTYTGARDPVPPASQSSLEDDLHRNELLYAAYLTNTVDITPNWTTHVGLGYAEVVPDLGQRYANGIFLGIIQSGFSRVIGSPSLPKERLLQFDVNATANYEHFRGRAGFFYGWLFDHVTYEANEIPDPSGARLLRAVSTDQAALTGFEAYGEYDWLPWLRPFGSVRYVHGQDLIIHQPLPQISPLESTVGLRLENLEASRPWGLEGGMRMVARQTRFASVRAMYTGGAVIPVEEPTPGFSTFYLRGYYRPRPSLNIMAGVENLFDRAYIEHLDLRLPAGQGFEATRVLAPGVTPFLAIEWTR